VQLSAAGAATTYTDYNALRGRTYVYRVIAIDSTGHVSEPSAYPLDKQEKDPTKYPARASITVVVSRPKPKP
jgi:hypothetical protein